MEETPDRKPVILNWHCGSADTDAVVILDDQREGYVIIAVRDRASRRLLGARSVAPGPSQAGILAVWAARYGAVIDKRGRWVDATPHIDGHPLELKDSRDAETYVGEAPPPSRRRIHPAQSARQFR